MPQPTPPEAGWAEAFTNMSALILLACALDFRFPAAGVQQQRWRGQALRQRGDQLHPTGQRCAIGGPRFRCGGLERHASGKLRYLSVDISDTPEPGYRYPVMAVLHEIDVTYFVQRQGRKRRIVG